MEHPLNSITDESSLKDLQQYMRSIIVQRGFDQDDWTYIVVILAEEVGELAKALRKYKALEEDDVRQDEHREWVQDEFADVLINLLDLANRFDIALSTAFKVKEEKHIDRFGC